MFKSFIQDTRGNVAMMFAICLVGILISVGAAVDYSSVTKKKQSIQDMVDAATLAAARSKSTDQTELEAIAAKFVAENNTDGYDITLDVSVVDDMIVVKGASSYKTVFMGIVGKGNLDISTKAASPISTLTPVKIALVLDTTHSMKGANITALKRASGSLLDELEKFESPLAVSVVPFGQYVNVGKHRKGSNWLDVSAVGESAPKEVCWDEKETITPRVCKKTGRRLSKLVVRDGRQRRVFYDEKKCTGGEKRLTGKRICKMKTTKYKWHGCVGSRQAPYNTQASFGSTRIKGAINKSCGTELTELTTDMKDVRKTIKKLKTSGDTYLPSGVMWGWRTLQDADPLKDTTKSVNGKVNRNAPVKVMVFMTDGENTRTKGGKEDHLHDGSRGTSANTETRALCEAAKADGIQIYTIGYRMSDLRSNSRQVLIDCATSPAYYRGASNAEELNTVFKELAGQLDFSRLSI